MAELRELHLGLGLADVETYRQSGNVVFTADSTPERLSAAIERAVMERLGHGDVDVLVRRADELQAVVGGNPFLRAGADPSTVHVTFLKDPPAHEIPVLDAGRFAPDSFEIAERAVYVHCPAGYARTKLDNGFFERLTEVRATTRNWATVTALAGLTAGAPARPRGSLGARRPACRPGGQAGR
jgi:uncharacterized protein (DUF1697 family)